MINDDDTPEDDETFTVSIPPSDDVTPPDPAVVTIIDDGRVHLLLKHPEFTHTLHRCGDWI